MPLTNIYGIPKFLERALTKVDSQYSKTGKYSVTQLDKPVQQNWLNNEYQTRIDVDVSEIMSRIRGTAVHHIVEQARVDEENEFELHEFKLESNFAGVTVSGTCDFYDVISNTIWDVKNTSVSKIQYGNFSDWERQLNYYAILFRRIGIYPKHLRIAAILTDWKKSQAKMNKNYPQIPYVTVEIPLWDVWEAEKIILENIRLFELSENCKTPEEIAEKFPCSEEDRWKQKNKFAVIKLKKDGTPYAKASKLCYTAEEAEEYIKENSSDKFIIESRPGDPIRCLDWCAVSGFCKQHNQAPEVIIETETSLPWDKIAGEPEEEISPELLKKYQDEFDFNVVQLESSPSDTILNNVLPVDKSLVQLNQEHPDVVMIDDASDIDPNFGFIKQPGFPDFMEF